MIMFPTPVAYVRSGDAYVPDDLLSPGRVDLGHPSRIHARVPNEADAREATTAAARSASAKPSDVR
jgi:hypothetical protein